MDVVNALLRSLASALFFTFKDSKELSHEPPEGLVVRDLVTNFSFLYTPYKGWWLSPAYGLTYSDTYWGKQTTSVAGKGKNISDNDLVKTGTAAGLSKKLCEDCLEEIKSKTTALVHYFMDKNHHTGRKVPVSERIPDISSPSC